MFQESFLELRITSSPDKAQSLLDQWYPYYSYFLRLCYWALRVSNYFENSPNEPDKVSDVLLKYLRDYGRVTFFLVRLTSLLSRYLNLLVY